MQAATELAYGARVEKATIPALFIFSIRTSVVRRPHPRNCRRWGAPHELVPVDVTKGDPDNHVIAGDALSPSTTASLAADRRLGQSDHRVAIPSRLNVKMAAEALLRPPVFSLASPAETAGVSIYAARAAACRRSGACYSVFEGLGAFRLALAGKGRLSKRFLPAVVLATGPPASRRHCGRCDHWPARSARSFQPDWYRWAAEMVGNDRQLACG
jgi:hypothetical protein